MTSDRIEELQKQTAYPESQSVHQALLKVWNEMQQDFNNRTCSTCKYFTTPQFNYSVCGQIGNVTVPYDFGCNKWEAK